MFKSSYRHEVRKLKYERSDVFAEEPPAPEGPGAPGRESLQDLNARFARYISRARVLEQRNAVFRKQLETLQRMEQAPGLEEAFGEQIRVNRQRVRELFSDRAKLERELREAERSLAEFDTRYRNECEFQQQLRTTLEKLNKEADSALLRNLEYQIQTQFLQDDINSTKDRHKKNLAEIQTYVSILNQINQTASRVPNMSMGTSEEQEKLLAQKLVPAMQSQLEDYKSALCQLQAQKQHLQTETAVLEQAIKTTQESYDEEIQQYNEQIETLRKDIEEAERSLEKYTNECRHLAMYQTSLENELERYKRIIENEDTRLNSAIISTPIALLTTDYSYTPSSPMSSRRRDITLQDITNVKPRQKNLAKKVLKKRDFTSKDVRDSGLEDGGDQVEGAAGDEDEAKVRREENLPLYQGVAQEGVGPQDVPDGAQISKAFDSLCNIVRDRMRRYMKQQEPIADFYTRGRYVLVSGESNYADPFFCSSSPSGGHIIVTLCDNMMPYDVGPSPLPSPAPLPLTPSDISKNGDKEGEHDKGEAKGGDRRGRMGDGNNERGGHEDGNKPAPDPGDDRRKSPDSSGHKKGQPPPPPPRTTPPVDSMSYEKVEVVESVEKFSDDNTVKGYEETATIVETMIEKTTKKKHTDRNS